jgi:phosphate/phosphite/phosphonate ABC transporter binding protein
MTPARLSFGLVVPPTATEMVGHVDQFVRTLGDKIGIPIERRDAPSYTALADDVRGGRLDIAWLPPIVFVRVGDAVTPLGSIMRGGNSTYEAVLVVPASSKIRSIDSLRGTRAGWVDKWSAAGYVLPRVNLSLLGTDPRTLFQSETFHGSHRAAIEALKLGTCDVAGTYARADDDGHVTTGAWSEIKGADVRVLATFGAIPPDVIALRSALAESLRDKAVAALHEVCASKSAVVASIFGGSELREGTAPGYESLKAALDMATSRGIFDAP